MLYNKGSRITFLDRLHFLFYELTSIHSLPQISHAVFWIVEKVMLLIPLLLLIYDESPWKAINSVLVKLNILSYFRSHSNDYAVCSFFLLTLFHCFILLLVIRMIYHKTSSKFLGWIISIGFPIVFRIVTQIVIQFGLYALVALHNSLTFSRYKEISDYLIESYGVTHIIILTLMTLCLLECIGVDLLYSFLYQEDNISLWCFNAWRTKVFDLCIKLIIYGDFILDSTNDYTIIVKLFLLALFAFKILVCFWTSLSYDPLAEIAELFYDSCSFLLICIIIICSVSNSYSFANYYHYSLVVPLYGISVCLIRYFSNPSIDEHDIKSEEDILNYIRKLLKICHMKEDSGYIALCGYLFQHKTNCTKANCMCKELLSFKRVQDSKRFKINLNNKVFETIEELPEHITESWKIAVLKILIEDINKQNQNSKSLCYSLALAELSFYYFGNCYCALTYIESVESRHPSLIYCQFANNLKNKIDLGMNKDNDGAKAILDSLAFQEKYNEFLTCIDDSCENTINFWSSLLSDKPDPVELMKLGKELFESRNKFLLLVSEISAISSEHTEFLVKFGLYMKLIFHDKTSASNAFQRILWAAENINLGFLNSSKVFSIFRRDSKVMMIVVSLEQNTFFQVTEMNNQVVHQLGYKREELLRFSGNKLMQACVADQHPHFIHQFFQTMKSTCLGSEKLRFLRHQEGYLVPCKATKKIVPTLSKGLQGIMLFYVDPLHSTYTLQKNCLTKPRIGAFFYDKAEKLLDVTKEVFDYLRFNKETIQSIKTNTTVTSLFPELKEESIVKRMKRPQGAIISYTLGREELEGYYEEGSTVKKEEIKKKLMWTRIVNETYGDQEVTIMFFSFLLERVRNEYIALPEFRNLVYEKEQEYIHNKRSSLKKQHQENIEAPTPQDDLQIFSDHMSIQSSMASMEGGSSMSSARHMELYAQDLQIAASSKETPTMIKRLSFVLVAFAVIVVILVGIESQQFYAETDELKNRFQMIEYFQIRYELISYLSVSPRSYDTYRKSTVPATFVNYAYRTQVRADRATYYNVKTTRFFDKFKLNYDYEYVLVTYGSEKYMASFSYAFIKYINEVSIFTQLNDYNLARSCINNMTNPICVENTLALDFCSDNGLYSLRISQEKVSNIIMRDLLKFAISGEKTLYIIISICIVIVFFSSIFIVVLLIWVIKDKSNVMEIFAGITNDEIQKIIGQATSLPIRKVLFDINHVNESNGDESKYWAILIKKFKRTKNSRKSTPNLSPRKGTATGTNRVSISKVKNSGESFEGKKEERKSIPKINIEILSPSQDSPNKESTPEEDKNGNDEQSPNNNDPNLSLNQELNEEAKKEEKKALLGQIDKRLRNSSIFRLGIVLFVFAAYGIASLYFNFYLHDFNAMATNYFYDLSKRNVYGVIMSAIIRESVRLQNKTLLLNNPAKDGDMYLQDYIDEMLRIEARIINFNMAGDRNIFKRYFGLTARLDTDEFCSFVDSYQVGQSGACNTSYGGPVKQGLTVGMAYFISCNSAYSAKIQASNLSDNAVANTISIDPALTFPGSKLIAFLQSALELQLIAFRQDTVLFYEMIQIIVTSKAACFGIAFLILYFFVILGLLTVLKSEIWLTHGMLNMIPIFVLENNIEVQHQLYQRKHIS